MSQDRQFPANNFDFDEDEDSSSDELSPSDGYFSQSSQVPSNVLVIDPSREESNSKAREAAAESSNPQYRAVTPPPSGPQWTRNSVYTPSSSSPRSSYPGSTSEDLTVETSSLLQDPPPQYEAATAGRGPPATSERAPLSPRNGTSYNTMTAQPAEPFNPGPRQPESMADDPGDMYDAEEATERKPRRSCFGFDSSSTGPRFRSFVVTMLATLGGICLILFLIGGIKDVSSPSSHKHADPTAPIIPPSAPSYSTSNTPTPPASRPTYTQTSTRPSPGKPTSSGPPSIPLDPPPKGIHEDRGSQTVTGHYTLNDKIYIRTTSGAVYISIELADKWSTISRPAVIDVETDSGSVNIEFVNARGRRVDKFHSPFGNDGTISNPRLFNLRVKTGSGSISGTYVHSNSTTLESKSGHISSTIFPIEYGMLPGAASTKSYLYTNTRSSSQTITLKDAITATTRSANSHPSSWTVSSIIASHISEGSGSLYLNYPGTWSGHLDVRKHGSGSVYTHGRDLSITKYTSSHVMAERPTPNTGVIGDSMIQVHEFGSGTVDFKCEDNRYGWNFGDLLGDDDDDDDTHRDHDGEGEDKGHGGNWILKLIKKVVDFFKGVDSDKGREKQGGLKDDIKT